MAAHRVSKKPKPTKEQPDKKYGKKLFSEFDGAAASWIGCGLANVRLCAAGARPAHARAKCDRL